MTIKAGTNPRECLQQISATLRRHELFYGHGTDNAQDEAHWLLDAVLRQVAGDSDADINPARARAIAEILRRRVRERKPLAYLLNEAWFAGLPFYVDERVLVPRSPIAELIGKGFEPLLRGEPARILDLCCGSGCIGIACALAFPDSRVDLADLSPEALQVAAVNVARYQLQDRVAVLRSDVFQALAGRRYDLIVTNPPYVSAEEHAALPEEYLREPRMGLVTEDEGLAIPRQILHQAAALLEPRGLLVLEVGDNWAALEEREAAIPKLWLEFEHGGHGVCAVRAQDLPTPQP